MQLYFKQFSLSIGKLNIKKIPRIYASKDFFIYSEQLLCQQSYERTT